MSKGSMNIKMGMTVDQRWAQVGLKELDYICNPLVGEDSPYFKYLKGVRCPSSNH